MQLLRMLAAAAVLVAAITSSAVAADFSGAGATFPYPIYAKWAEAYKKQTGITVHYQSVGSGEGIRQIQNKEVTFGAAAANANWAGTPGFGVIITNEPGAASWPIAGATFILVHKQPSDPAAAAAALKFFNWAYAKGGKMAEELDYVPMPGNVVSAVQRLWAAQVKDASGKPLFVLPK